MPDQMFICWAYLDMYCLLSIDCCSVIRLSVMMVDDIAIIMIRLQRQDPYYTLFEILIERYLSANKKRNGHPFSIISCAP
jgi:hypothetical protein